MCIKYPNVHEIQKKKEILRITSSQTQFKKQIPPKKVHEEIKTDVSSNDVCVEKQISERSPMFQSSTQVNVSKTDLINGSAALVFISVMIHANMCKSCPQLSCRKMRVVLQHHDACKRIELSLGCQVCEQLISVVSKHARESCTVNDSSVCPVPLCDSIKRSTFAEMKGLGSRSVQEITK